MSIRGSLFMAEQPTWVIEGPGDPVGCLDFNRDSDEFCYSHTLRHLVVASALTGETLRTFTPTISNYPFVGCRYHPTEGHKILSITRDGFIFLFDCNAESSSGPVHVGRHLGCNLICLSVDPYGDTFALAATDGTVRIHSLNTLQRINALIREPIYGSNESTVVTTVTFHPDDGNIVVSASTSRVYVWDVRTGLCERTLFGPHIRGPGVAVHQNTVYTASFRDQKQVEVWDFTSMKKIRDIVFDKPHSKPAPLTTISCSRNGIVFVAAGAAGAPGQGFDAISGIGIGSTKPFKAHVCVSAMAMFSSACMFGTEAGRIQCHAIRSKPPKQLSGPKTGADALEHRS